MTAWAPNCTASARFGKKSSTASWIAAGGNGSFIANSGRISESASLARGILSSRHTDFTNGPAVQRLRDWAATPATSRPADPPSYDNDTAVDPFGGFDLGLLGIR